MLRWNRWQVNVRWAVVVVVVSLATQVGSARSWRLAASAMGQQPSRSSATRPILVNKYSGRVKALAFSPDGKTLAAGGGDKTAGKIKLWDVETGQLQRSLIGHSDWVESLAYTPDGKMLVSGGRDKRVMLWDLQTEKSSSTFKRLEGEVHAVALSPDGKTLAAATLDPAVRLWNLETGRLKTILQGFNTEAHALAFSPDGTLLATAGLDRKVRLWEVRTGRLKHTLERHTDYVFAVVFSPDGKTLASAGDDRMVRLWDVQKGWLQRTLEGHTGSVFSVAFSPDGKMLVSGSADETLGIWDPETGELKHRFGFRHHHAHSIAFAPDGTAFASGSCDGSIILWEWRTQTVKRELTELSGYVNSVAFSPDNKMIASGGYDRAVRLWDAETGALKRMLTGHTGYVASVAYSPDGKTVASASSDRTIRLWDTETGDVKRTLGGDESYVWSVAFSPDGKTLMSGGGTNAGGEVRLWDAETGELRRTLRGHRSHVWSVAFSPNVGNGRRAVPLLASGSWDGTVKLWDAQTGELKRTLTGHQDRVFSVAFSPDGSALASGSGDEEGGEMKLWNPDTGGLRRDLPGHNGWVLSLAFSPDSKKLVSGSWDNTMNLWGAPEGRLLATFVNLPPEEEEASSAESPVVAAQPSLPTLSQRGVSAVRVVGVETKPRSSPGGKTLDPREVRPSHDYLVMTPNGYYTGSAAADRIALFRLGVDFFPVESFQARYYRPQLVKRSLTKSEEPSPESFKGATPPVVRFTAPQDGDKVAGESIEVTVEATDDSGVERVEFYVNGTRVDTKPTASESRSILARSILARSILARSILARDIPSTHKVAREFTATIPLPPNEKSFKLQAKTFDQDGLESPPEEITLTRENVTGGKGRLLGLCVGVSEYKDPDVQDLNYAHRDATELAKALNQQGGRPDGIYDTAEVIALTNEAATRGRVKEELANLLTRLTTPAAKADTVVLMFAGHGWKSDEGSFYFATHEVDTKNLQNTALPWGEVVQWLTKLSENSKRVIVLLDACHSGSAATNDELFIETKRGHAGVLVCASCRAGERSYEDDQLLGGHGAFTAALIEGLGKGEADSPRRPDGVITSSELRSYLEDIVPVFSKKKQTPNFPLWGDFGEAFPLARVTR